MPNIVILSKLKWLGNQLSSGESTIIILPSKESTIIILPIGHVVKLFSKYFHLFPAAKSGMLSTLVREDSVTISSSLWKY